MTLIKRDKQFIELVLSKTWERNVEVYASDNSISWMNQKGNNKCIFEDHPIPEKDIVREIRVRKKGTKWTNMKLFAICAKHYLEKTGKKIK